MLKARTARWLIVLLVCVVHSVFAQSTIRSLRVSGNSRIEKAVIEQAIRSMPGTVLRRAQVAQDIMTLYRLGYFEDVKVLYDEATGELVVEVKEKQTVREIAFSGNSALDKDDLKDLVTVKAFSFYDEVRVSESVEKIKSKYQDKGYYLVSVDPKLETLEHNEAKLTFVIRENKKIRIRHIEIIGNKKFSDDELKSTLFSKEKGFLSFLTGSGMYRQEILNQDRQLLRDFYGKRGYIKAKIGLPNVQITPDKTSLMVTHYVEEGEIYTVDRVTLDGELIKDREELEKEIKLKPKNQVDTSLIQQDMLRLSNIYADEGYAYANVIPQDEYNEDDRTVGITYLLQPGPKVKIDRIRFVGNDSTRDKVLRREMAILEGDVYSGTKLRQSRENLERLALFEEVKLSTPRGRFDDSVDVIIEVKEKQTGTFSIGAGFNTLESFQVLGRIEKRNLFGYGVDLSLDARVGKLTQLFNLQYRDEYFLDSRWGLTLNAFNIDQRFNNFDLTSRGGSVGFDYPLYQKGLERIRFGVTYSFVDKILGGLRPTLQNIFQGGVTSSVTASISRDTRNRVFEPTQGSLLRVTEEVSGGPFGGENEFSKLEFDGRWFFNWLEPTGIPFLKDTVFAVGIRAGYVSPIRNGARVPLFERYFPGGILTLRGFLLRSLGPKIQIAASEDPSNLGTSDFTIGGNKQFVANFEYIFPIVQAANIRGVVFFDVGNAFDEGESLLTWTGQRKSTGFGIRWFSPVGPLRFEWGYPLDRKEGERSSVFDFTIGSIF